MPNSTTISTAQYRVEISPALDLWMRGARYGTVIREYHARNQTKTRMVLVQLDKWPRPLRFRAEDVTVIGET